ncbi:MAG: beta galactosidase jelly roll domain-containing protein [Clostridia bacterium]|nr:beta galactosidase jelly roll domain-containing protein [Clostridia bacterium]
MAKNDQFANIAISGISVEGKGLSLVKPAELQIKALPLRETSDIRTIFPDGIRSEEALAEELQKLKERLKPFKRRLAPPMDVNRVVTELKSFLWRVETQEDRRDFRRALDGLGEWERVNVPHFGEPLGKAATLYRTEFDMDAPTGDETVLLRFDGVDYKAQVFVNGAFVGAHEGFFAPFELDISAHLQEKKNVLLVRVENDYVQKRSPDRFGGEQLGGDKIYAATGPGYDEPLMGWHHCPPGMGIYQRVFVEKRCRVHISDVYVRPLPENGRAEAWVYVESRDPGFEDVRLELSVYGKNHTQTVFEKMLVTPMTSRQIGLGDTFTEASLKAQGRLEQPVPLLIEKGENRLKIPFEMGAFRWWSPEEPYLYELQVRLVRPDGSLLDAKAQSFGMRSFTMDTEREPKGTLYLNGKKVRLRGANTMGHEQQCVLKGDYEQLENDILLAKLCNMNFLRLTQRPVQEEVYDYCDCLGLMTQTDLPLFGVLRIPTFAEALRQTGEMIDLVRCHPCNVMVSYINEPFPNANNQPHRQFTRPELEQFFACADIVCRLHNPEQVIKQVDGDYDPPCPSLPDNHCYTCWYNGCGIPAGALHRGWWMPIKDGWNCGCGEFGAEGLDPVALMRRHYPQSWLPAEGEKNWSPARIVGAQTANFHYFFYETPHTLEGWVEESQKHQAYATRMMTESFRRNPRMVSNAIHLFIDAFPAGWMKAIMDCERRPKQAYFAYRAALSPLMVSLRTDRLSLYAGEKTSVELWLCNDLPDAVENLTLSYEISQGETVFLRGEAPVFAPASDAVYVGSLCAKLPPQLRGRLTVAARLSDKAGQTLYANDIELRVYALLAPSAGKAALPGASEASKARRLAEDLGISEDAPEKAHTILIDDYAQYAANRNKIDQLVYSGARAVFLELPEGEYDIGGKTVSVKQSCMMPMNFVSRDSGHPLVEGFEPDSFRNWYDLDGDMIAPLNENTFTAEGFAEILASGNTDVCGDWGRALVAGEYSFGKGSYIVCELKLAGRTKHNPVAGIFAQRLLGNA